LAAGILSLFPKDNEAGVADERVMELSRKTGLEETDVLLMASILEAALLRNDIAPPHAAPYIFLENEAMIVEEPHTQISVPVDPRITALDFICVSLNLFLSGISWDSIFTGAMDPLSLPAYDMSRTNMSTCNSPAFSNRSNNGFTSL